MQEIELKFQVPAGARAAVDAAVAGRERRARLRLQAAYFDTPGRELAAAGLALRVRREGRRWVQTLKGAGDDGLTRAEHNVALPAPAGEPPAADPALHADTPVGKRLLKVLAQGQALTLVFRSDVLRRSRTLRTRLGSVELAFDEGSLVALERRLPVREFEVELVSGSPRAVIETARRWLARHGLWLDTRSKAERGDLLARGESMAAERKQQNVRLSATMSIDDARRCVLRSCLDQVSVNASQVASGDYRGEHVHQLRVGLRRLRSALALFDGKTPDPALKDPATALFRELGAARDAEAVGRPLAIELEAVLRGIGMSLALPQPSAPANAQPPEDLVRSATAQSLLLELLAQTQADAVPALASDLALRDQLGERLKRWHKQVARDARRFAELDDPARHELRKRAKRLRYGVEFASSLFERRAVRRYLKALRAMQEELGRLIDTMVGLESYTEHAASDPAALFAVGWLAARRERLIAECEPVLKDFSRVKGFWR